MIPILITLAGANRFGQEIDLSEESANSEAEQTFSDLFQEDNSSMDSSHGSVGDEFTQDNSYSSGFDVGQDLTDNLDNSSAPASSSAGNAFAADAGAVAAGVGGLAALWNAIFNKGSSTGQNAASNPLLSLENALGLGPSAAGTPVNYTPLLLAGVAVVGV